MTETILTVVRSLLEDERVEEALETALRASEQETADAAVFVALAEAAAAMDDYRQTARASRKALLLLENESSPLCRDAWLQAAWADWRTWDFEAAERCLRKCLELDADLAAAWDLLASVLEFQGRKKESEEAYRRAAHLSPRDFPPPARISDKEMSDLLEESLDELPLMLQAAAREVSIVIRELPDRDMAVGEGGEDLLPPDLLGLFVGTSRPERSSMNSWEQPPVIFLFKRNLELTCTDRSSLLDEIVTTLRHELAHYLGFAEDDMERLGLE